MDQKIPKVKPQIPKAAVINNLHHYFDQHVCLSIRPASGRHKIFFSLQLPLNHPLTTGVVPRG